MHLWASHKRPRLSIWDGKRAAVKNSIVLLYRLRVICIRDHASICQSYSFFPDFGVLMLQRYVCPDQDHIHLFKFWSTYRRWVCGIFGPRAYTWAHAQLKLSMRELDRENSHLMALWLKAYKIILSEIIDPTSMKEGLWCSVEAN